MDKNADAFRTISEAAGELDLPQHVLRFWETRFPQIKPLKRGGGRRYYRPRDLEILRLIKHLLYQEGYTIRGVQRVLKEQGSNVLTGRANGDLDFSAPIAPETALSQDSPFSNVTPPSPSPQLPSAGRPAQADPPFNTSPGSPSGETGDTFLLSSGGLTAEVAGRLRTALAVMTECETILAAARRR